MTRLLTIDTNDLYKKRELLEQIVTEQNPKQIELELCIYDTLTEISVAYHDKITRRAEEVTLAIHALANEPIEQVTRKGRASIISVLDKIGRHRPAFIIGFNVDVIQHDKYLWNGNHTNPPVGMSILDPEATPYLNDLARKDNATILDQHGIIRQTRTYLTELDLHQVPQFFDDTSKSIYEKFRIHANTRHSYSRAASWFMPGTIWYTLSEETSHIYRFGGVDPADRGKITFCTLEEFSELKES